MARQPPNITESRASLGAMNERNAVEAAFDDGVRSRNTRLRFCPYLNPMMLLCLTPFVFCFLAVVAEGLNIPWLTFWLAIASLLALASWCLCYAGFACSPTESWGKVLRLRLGHWPPGRTRTDSYRQYFDLLLFLPFFIGLGGSFALSILSWARWPAQIPTTLKGASHESVVFFLMPMTALVVCASVVLIIRLAVIRRTGTTWCLDCGNRLTDEPEQDRCLECGSVGTRSSQ
ncbi:MAG: hypothetical protein CMJ53_04640 [Planctomycetaceae bacterium]|nr:hypothetical protein [Planctomycetaceae bacterium]